MRSSAYVKFPEWSKVQHHHKFDYEWLVTDFTHFIGICHLCHKNSYAEIISLRSEKRYSIYVIVNILEDNICSYSIYYNYDTNGSFYNTQELLLLEGEI